MLLEIESTADIVAIEGIPCRKWKVIKLDDDDPGRDSFVFTRLLLIDKTIPIACPHIMIVDGPNPPNASDIGEALGVL